MMSGQGSRSDVTQAGKQLKVARATRTPASFSPQVGHTVLIHLSVGPAGAAGMRKYPKSQTITLVKRGATALLVLELGLFAGFYHVYHRMNTDRDFRYYMKNNYSLGLETFYSVGEFFDEKNKTRQLDEAVWAKQFAPQAGVSEKKEQ